MNKIHIIAEAGNNHNGDYHIALDLVRKAKESGANTIKFQIIYPENLYVEKLLKDGALEDNPVIEQRRRFMLTDAQYFDLARYCNELKIGFTASVFDKHGIDLLCELDVPFIKIASVDLNNISLLRYAAKTGKKLVISTGFSTMEEILHTVNEVEEAGCKDLVLMHCISVYPSRLKITNLQFIDQLKAVFRCPVGFSDHSPNSLAAAIAVSKGCTWFEKHITLDKKQEGFDHNFALEPYEFTQFVCDLHDAEEACDYHAEKLSNDEKEVRMRARRSLYAAKDMQAGEVLKESDIVVVRPSGNYSASDIDCLIGRQLKKEIQKYENIDPQHIL